MWPKLFSPSLDQPAVAFWIPCWRVNVWQLGVWYQESEPQVAGSLYILGQVTTCLQSQFAHVKSGEEFLFMNGEAK